MLRRAYPDEDSEPKEKLLSPDGTRRVDGRGYKGHLKISLYAVTPGGKNDKLVATLEDGEGSGEFGAEFSPDSRLLVTTAGEFQAKIWDARTGKVVRVLKGHTGPLRSVAFSEEGGKVITTSRDASIRIWSVATGELLQLLSGHGSFAAHVSADGRRMLTIGDGTLRQWQLAPAIGSRQFKPTLQVPSNSVRLSQDGQRLLLGSANEQTVHVVSLAPLLSVRSIALAPRGVSNWCASAPTAASTRPHARRESDANEDKATRAFAFSNDGAMLIGSDIAFGDTEAEKLEPRCAWTLDTGHPVPPPPHQKRGPGGTRFQPLVGQTARKYRRFGL
jgi:WD40 repeat protein